MQQSGHDCAAGHAARPPPRSPRRLRPRQRNRRPRPPRSPISPNVELRFAWWGSQDRHNRTIKAIELFQQQHPNITITYEFAGFQDYFTKMATYATGGNLPDLMQQDYATITQWTGNGLLMPLDDYVNDRTINLTDVPKSVRSTAAASTAS